VLRRRLAVEEAVLASNASYRDAMGGKPRFVPHLRRQERPRGAPWPMS